MHGGITVHILEQWFRSKRTVLTESVWGLLSPKLHIPVMQRESWACALRGLCRLFQQEERRLTGAILLMCWVRAAVVAHSKACAEGRAVGSICMSFRALLCH